MNFPASFFRIAAVCSLASAVTTLLLIFLPRWYLPVDGIEARMALVHHPAYTLRSLIYLLHPLLVLCAALGIAAARWRAAPAAVLVGTLGFVLWAFTEAGQQTMTLFAFDRWRMAWPEANADARAAILVQMAVYDALWDALYVLLLIGFMAGNLLLAQAYRNGDGFTRAIAVALAGAGLLTGTLLLREFGHPVLPAALEAWFYPLWQPAARAAIGVWLWRYSRTAMPTGSC